MNINIRGALISIVFAAALLSGCAGTGLRDSFGKSAHIGQKLSLDYPGREAGSHFFWELQRGDERIYLLGSIHAGTRELYPLDDDIMQSFARSDTLVVEMNLIETDMSHIQAYMDENSMLPGDQRISDFISPEADRELRAILKKYGIPYSSVERFRPWVISTTLGSMSAFETSMSAGYGVDMYFTREAYDMGMDIRELESAVGQLEILNSLSMDAQVADVETVIMDFLHLDEQINELLATWATGNLPLMEELIIQPFTEDPAAGEYYQNLFVDRNMNWRHALLEMVAEKTQIFVVVGTGHLIGPDSVVQMLRKDGFSARRY